MSQTSLGKNTNYNLERLAWIISILLGPQFWAPLFLVILILSTGLSYYQRLILLPILIFLQIIVPVVYIRVAIRKGWVQSWDIPRREERYELWLLLSITSFLATVAARLLGTPLAFKVLVILFALLTALVLISLVWKISFHMVSSVGIALMINYLTGNKLTLLYFGIPLIFWSRLALKRHSVAQLLAGGLVAFLVTEGGLLFIQ